uniref:LITAF domain-containing protein n=1 Tax=Glossina pallidipes TaxID=7398 RepID=A0A1A9ZYM9_GLOPL
MPTKQEIINIMESNLSEEVSPVAAMQRMPPPYTADRSNFDTYTDSSIYSAPPSNSYTNTPTTTTTYGSRSLLAKCHTCGGKNWTRLEYENGLMTHIIAAVLCLTTLLEYEVNAWMKALVV